MELGRGSDPPVEKEHRGLGLDRVHDHVYIMLGKTVPFLSVYLRGSTASLGTKELAGSTELPHSLAYLQRHLLRRANLDTSF